MRILVVEDGTQTRLEVDRPILRVGRALDNDIRLANPLVSRHHCRLERNDGRMVVVDLGSANGTQINGERIAETADLAPEDELQIGSAKIRLEVERRAPRAGERTIVAPADAADGGGGFGEEELGLSTLLGEDSGPRRELATFAAITRELLSETELEPLLRQIVDAALRLVGGERGFLLLDEDATPGVQNANRDPARMSVRVARHFDGSDIPVPASRLSRGIAASVLSDGVGLFSIDAARDERFREMQSVEELRLRSVMCVPILLSERVEGVLYVDNRLQQAVFSKPHLELLSQLSDQAALAIRNARLVAELRARNERLRAAAEQVERLNAQLGRKVRDRDSQLAVARAELSRERGRHDYTAIVGASDGMQKVFAQLDRIVESDLPVLIHGESGTGKELIARAIHKNGPRAERPFVVENCAALPDSLLESELFGHVRGAFTGADRSKKGLIEQSHGGSLFLDEIGDMSPAMQKKLLRVLQEGEVRPVGSDQRVRVDVRLVAASHRDLDEMVAAGEFREDLFYRVNVLSVRLPPLRERRDDIPLLAETLLARAARESGRPVPHLAHEVVAALVSYDWPGNVRELENEMRRLVVLAEGTVTLDQLSARVQSGGDSSSGPSVPDPLVDGDLRGAVARFERAAIEAALSRAMGNKSRAANELGISRFALQRKMEKYGLARDDGEGEASA